MHTVVCCSWMTLCHCVFLSKVFGQIIHTLLICCSSACLTPCFVMCLSIIHLFMDLSVFIYTYYISFSNYPRMNFTYIPILPTYPSFSLFLCLPIILCLFQFPLMINFLTVMLCIFKEINPM
jgi:hypothetical protein